MPNSDKIKKLIEELQSPDPRTRRLSAQSLGIARAMNALPFLESALNDPDPSVQARVISAILRIDSRHPGALEGFRNFLQHPDPEFRLEMVTRTSEINPFPHEVYPILLNLLSDESANLRLLAAGELGRLAEQKKLTDSERETALVHLQRGLRDPEIKVRQTIAGVFGSFVPDGAVTVPKLLESYELETNAELRLAILVTLYKFGGESAPAVPLVAQALEDANDDIRYQAAVVLAYVGEAAKQVILQLIKALHDWHGGVRYSAMKALSNCGKEAYPAIPELERIRDSEESFRECAIDFIKKIRGGD